MFRHTASAHEGLLLIDECTSCLHCRLRKRHKTLIGCIVLFSEIVFVIFGVWYLSYRTGASSRPFTGYDIILSISLFILTWLQPGHGPMTRLGGSVDRSAVYVLCAALLIFGIVDVWAMQTKYQQP